MADVKITELPELTEVAADDYLEIVDTSTNTNKKISRETLTNFAWQDWTPTQSGWTALPTGTYRYFQVGKMCFFAIDITAGTSNSDIAVLSLPVAAKSGTFWGGVNGMAMDNGTVLSVPTKWYIDASSGNIRFGSDMGLGLWTTSGTKLIRCAGFYETE